MIINIFGCVLICIYTDTYIILFSAYINLYSYKQSNRDLCSPIICQRPIPSVCRYLHTYQGMHLYLLFRSITWYLPYYLYLEVNIGNIDFWTLSFRICYMSNIICYLWYYFLCIVLDFNFFLNNYSFIFKNSFWGLWN